MSLRPTDPAELAEAISRAAAAKTTLEIRAGASKAAIGTGAAADDILDLSAFAGVVDYDPPELVLTVRAATKLDEIEALVEAQGQMLAFEPFDHGPILGRHAGAATLGGVVASGTAGSRRLSAGNARDHLLGFRGVSGRGEAFVAGAKVVKNVTGYDLPKLVCGSWGRLVALTEITLKVLPRPRETATLAIAGLGPREAHRAMARAMGSPAEVAAALHAPRPDQGGPLTLFRVEGFGPSVAARRVMLSELLAGVGTVETLDPDAAAEVWRAAREAAWLRSEPTLWRIGLPARAFPDLVATFEPLGARWFADWAGALVWLGFDGDPARVRAEAARLGGHATLLRATPARRGEVVAFQPPSEAIAALERRVRRAFDPDGVFETGRFGD